MSTRRRVPGMPRAAARRFWPLVVALALVGFPAANATPVSAATSSILMPASEMGSRPTSGSPWSALLEVANEAAGTPDLCDPDSEHNIRTLASALVFARTGSSTHRTKARNGIMAAIPTLQVGCSSAILALGRQLGSYVLAADLIDLGGTDATTFKSFLTTVRTKDLGGHSRWRSLTGTHEDSNNNWGAFAGASRIAASLYLGDTADVARAAKVVQGFLGDRSAYAGFRGQTADSLYDDEKTWACSATLSGFRPINGACTRNGINLDGAIVGDIYRGGPLRAPALDPGIPYTIETLQGVMLQVELLYRNGYSGAWGWSSSALKRAANFVTRDAAAGGTGWNKSTVARHVPWLLNRRYGTSIPTQPAAHGRIFGFTDWLYGGASVPAPTTSPPVAAAPGVVLYRTTSVPSTRIPAQVRWSPASASAGVARYQLQIAAGTGSFTTLTLSSPTTRSRTVQLTAGTTYRFRLRVTDRAGRTSAWVYSTAIRGARIQESSAAITWTGPWQRVASSIYLGGANRSTRATGATATYRFTGSGFAWVGPIGPTRGKATVEIDGKVVATVDLYASTFRARKVVYAASLAHGTHTVRIRALGTSGRPTVALDALYILRRP